MFHPVCTSLYSPPISSPCSQQKARPEQQQAVPGLLAGGDDCEATPVGHQPLTSRWDIPMDMLPSQESSPALPLTATQGRLLLLILTSLDTLGGLSLEGTVGSPRGKAKG